MAERGRPILRGGGARKTIVVSNRPLEPTHAPDDFGTGDPSPRIPRTFARQGLVSRGAGRTTTVHAADGVVPVILGGAIPVGGFLIAYKRMGPWHYFDFALGEGPIAASNTAKFGDKTAAAVGVTTEFHLGAAGDTTSTLMSEAIPGYYVPDYLAHVVIRARFTDQEFSPMDFTCLAAGWVGYNPTTGTFVYATDNPFAAAFEMLTNPRATTGAATTDYSHMELADFVACQAVADHDIGAGVKRWQFGMRIDSPDTLKNHVSTVLAHAGGHLRYSGGKYGCWVDWTQARALDNEGNPLTFRDSGDAVNMAGRASAVGKSRGQIPTVVTLDYTDAPAQFVDSSVQYPATLAAGVDWIEQRFSLPGILQRARATRMAQLLYNLLQLDHEISLPTWFRGIIPLPGDRIQADSRRIIGGGITPPNTGAVAGVEDLICVSQSYGGAGIVLRCELYRDDSFSDIVSVTGGPSPPDPDPTTAPDPPTGIILENIVDYASGVPTVIVRVRWTPAVASYPTETLVTFSRDAGVFFNELGTFVGGPVYLYNPTLGQDHVFRLYTRRISTGQLSAVAEEDIVPSFLDPTLPEVTQVSITNNHLEFYGPVRTTRFRVARPPAPTLVIASGGAGVTPGVHKVAVSEITSWGESLMGDQASITVSAVGGPYRINVSNADPTPTPDMKAKKLYISKSGGTDLYFDSLFGGTTDALLQPDSAYVANDLAPDLLDDVSGWAVYDAWGVADPTAPDAVMPLFEWRPRNLPPQHYGAIDCTPIVHATVTPTTTTYAIKVYIRVISSEGGASTGTYFETTTAAFPPADLIANTTTEENKVISLTNTAKAKMFAGHAQAVTINTGTYHNYALPEVSCLSVGGTPGAVIITGFVNPNAPGFCSQIEFDDNGTGRTYTFKHENTNSSAANRFSLPGGVDFIMAAVNRRCGFFYDNTVSRWKLRFKNF